MCQRYVLPDQLSAEREFLPTAAWWKFTRKFNVATTQYVPAVRMHEGQSEGVMLRWGLIPAWLEGEPKGPPLACVPGDRIEDEAAYRVSWPAGRRCILPMAGFYAWQLTPKKYRQPFFVSVIDRPVFGIAALWDRWVSEDDDVIESCSVITVPGNELLTGIGVPGAPMPAILRRRHYDTWLQGPAAAAKSVLQAYKSEWMQAHPVSPRINGSDVDDPGLIRNAS